MNFVRRYVQRNIWALSERCWEEISAYLRPGMRTLECGCGESTRRFERLGCRHVALEHDWRYHCGCRSVVIRPLSGDPPWYDWEPDDRFDFILVDGPPGETGRRGIMRALPRCLKRDTIIVVDDVNRRNEMELAHEIAQRFGLRGRFYRNRVMFMRKDFCLLLPSEALPQTVKA